MRNHLLLFFIFFLVVTSSAATHVAVLETISEKDIIGRSEKVFLTDKLREMAKTVLPDYMGYVIMTRENINAMLPPGKSVEECEGSCLVETGKNIAADFVAQARVGKFGQQLTLTVELYETAGNNLVGTFTTKKSDAEGLLIEIEEKAGQLFKKIVGNVPLTNKIDIKDETLLNDLRDGQQYRIVKIDKQIWMAENLNFSTSDSWFVKKKGCDTSKNMNCNIYGRLYTWSAAKNVCPSGWHLPSKSDFDVLLNTVGSKSIAGKLLKSKDGWKNNGNGTDVLGFSVWPVGKRNLRGKFESGGLESHFWCSSDKGNKACNMLLDSDTEKAYLGLDEKKNAFSVRCIRD
jgi:uncharacterized protein (TIGR02145 family)